MLIAIAFGTIAAATTSVWLGVLAVARLSARTSGWVAAPVLALYAVMCVVRPPVLWLSDALVFGAAVMAATLIARGIGSAGALVAFAITAGIADFVSFSFGVTKMILAANRSGGGLLRYLAISVPLPDGRIAPIVGIGDLIILGVLMAVMRKLGWGRASLLVPAGGLAAALAVGLAVGGIYAVPFMAAAVVGYAMVWGGK